MSLPKPYYQDDFATIYCGDWTCAGCRELQALDARRFGYHFCRSCTDAMIADSFVLAVPFLPLLWSGEGEAV